MIGAKKSLIVSEMMTSPVHTCELDASAGVAADQMHEHKVMHLVVVDAGGKVRGVVSDRDLRAAQPSALLVKDPGLRDKALSLLKVENVMSQGAHTVSPGQPARSALLLMRKHRVGSIPVVDDDGRPVGIITHGNVVELALDLMR